MRRTVTWTFGIGILFLAAVDGASGQDAARTVDLRAFNVGKAYWFKVHGDAEENPSLYLPPGAEVELTLRNTAHVGHNLRLGPPLDLVTPVLQPGEGATHRFTVPADASGTTEYWCEPHRHLGMRGQIHFAAEAARLLAGPGSVSVLAGLALGAAVLRRTV